MIRQFLIFLFAALYPLCAASAPAKTFGNPKAPKGGTFVIGFPDYPKHLLYYLAFDELAAAVNALTFDTLMDSDPQTNDLLPLLASSWTISPDKKVFTLKLDPSAKFSDGTPVTSADVKFTFDTLMDPKNKTAPFQSAYQSLESCATPDPGTVVFKARNTHFKNLEKIASLAILPKHFYSQGDFNKAFHSKLLGSGPYVLEEVKQGERIRLKRNTTYWAANLSQNLGRYNFDNLVFKSVPEYSVQFEMFKRGDIDYFYFLSSKMWSTETDSSPFAKNHIKKLKMINKIPFSTQGIAWNMRRPLFQDERVRLALSHLFNREKMIPELFYSNYDIATGIINAKSEYHSPNNKPVAFNPKRARELLQTAGWKTTDKEGVLIKDGQRFDFEMITAGSSGMRFLTVYQEELKKAGISMRIRQMDWSSSLKLIDDRQFDATDIARGRDTEPSDFVGMWGVKEADTPGSGNLTGYKNPELDKLDAQIGETFDRKKRIPLVRKIDEMIGKAQPITMAWEPSYTRLAYWNKFSFPGNGYFNYSNWSSVFTYWWWDEAKANALKEAIASGKTLP